MTAVPHAPPVHPSLPVFDAPDAAFLRRWSEWKARRRAHDQRVGHFARVSAVVAGAVALAVLAARAYLP